MFTVYSQGIGRFARLVSTGATLERVDLACTYASELADSAGRNTMYRWQRAIATGAPFDDPGIVAYVVRDDDAPPTIYTFAVRRPSASRLHDHDRATHPHA